MTVDVDDYTELAELWEVSLRGANRSPHTIDFYLTGLRQFARWCQHKGIDPDLTRDNAEAFTASLLADGKSSGTVAGRQTALRMFSRWLSRRDPPEIDHDQLATLEPVKLEQKVVEGLTPAEVAALLQACSGKGFTAARDLAIVRLMLATGARASEVIDMKTWDVQVGAGSAVITKGKGGKGRRIGFGPKTAEAIGRYLRARKRHALAERPELWLAARRRVLTYDGLYTALQRRAETGGISGFHPHRLRHTWAVQWSREGGSMTGLMAAGGWVTMEMPSRYFGSAAQELAAEEAKRLGLGEF
jgi:site-specific recombinase XerD